MLALKVGLQKENDRGLVNLNTTMGLSIRENFLTETSMDLEH